MTTLNTYEFKGITIRTVSDADGQLWFGLKDIVCALELTDTPTIWYSWLDDFEKDSKSYMTPGGRQYLRMVNQTGLNRLISESPVEDDFKAWANETFYGEIKPKKYHKNHEYRLYTPTRIGETIGGLSAQQVNNILCDMGMQTAVMDFNKKRYMLTSIGKTFGVNTRFKNKKNEEIHGVMWRKPIINLLSARLQEEKRNTLHA